MPRIASDTASLLADLTKRLERLVDAARKEGRDEALSDVRAVVGGALAGGTVKRGRKPGRPAKKTGGKRTAKKPGGAKRKSWWDTASEDQKKARVKKMLAGRGLKPKS